MVTDKSNQNDSSPPAAQGSDDVFLIIHDPARGLLHIPPSAWASLYHGWGMALDDPTVKKKFVIEKAFDPGQPRGENGRWVEVGNHLRAAHPYPPAGPVLPPGALSPKRRAEDPSLAAALEEHDKRAAAFNRAFAADLIHRMLNEEADHPVKLPVSDASMDARIRRFQRALEAVDAASANMTRLGEAFSHRTSEVADSHSEGRAAWEAAKEEAQRRWNDAVRTAEEHLAAMPKNEKRDKAERILDRKKKEKSIKPIEKALWDASKHPRGGDSKNPGRFSAGSGSRGNADKPTNRASKEPSANQPTRKEPPLKPDGPTRRPSSHGGWGDVGREHDERVKNEPEFRAQVEAAEERSRRAATPPSSAADKSPLHAALEQSPLTYADPLGGGVNKTWIVELGGDTWGVFKPADGESTEQGAGRFGVPRGTQYRREIAASRIADTLGFDDLVPVTTFRDDKNFGKGSVQQFRDAQKTMEAEEPFDGPEDAARAAAFDYLVGHLDRHKGNWLVQGDKLVLIDNGLSLPTAYHNRDFFNMEFWRHAVTKDLSLPDLSSVKDKWPEVEKELKSVGVEDAAINLAKKRFDALTSGIKMKIADLPSLLDEGDDMRGMVDKYERHNRRIGGRANAR